MKPKPNGVLHSFAYIALLFVLLIASSPTKLHAQAQSGINGTVTDATGAVIPNAAVSITNTATGVIKKGASTSAGTYRITDLTPGTYNVRVERDGFQPIEIKGVHVDAGVFSTANAALATGAATQTVEVTAPAISLQTAQPELGTTIQNELVKELPVELGGRDRQIDNFIFLAPGVSGSGFSHRIDGGVDMQNEVVFNGIPAVQSETQGMQTNINPPFEMVDQFTVLQNVFSAQYGLAQGVAQYQFSSGGDKLHGDAFEILRNNYFDAKGANPPLDPVTNLPMVPNDKENNFGFSLSGPVWLPKVYDGRHKTFFWVSSDWYRLNSAITGNMTVPTQAMKTGDFSAFPQPIYVPNGPLPAGCNPGAAPGQQFPGNVIPQGCISAVSQTLISLIPNPATGGFTNNLPSQVTNSPTRQTNWGFNIDHHINDRQTVHFSFWRDKFTSSAWDQSGYFNGPLSGEKTEPRIGTGIFGTYTNAVSNNLVMTAGIGWMGEINNELNAHPGYKFSAVEGGTILPTINFSGFDAPTAYGVNSGGETNSTNRKLGIALENNWLWTRGKHTINFGMEVRRSYQDDNECQSCGGQFSFAPITTSNGDINSNDPLNENNTGSAFASFLLGTVDHASRNFAVENKLRNLYFAPYVQDDIKLTPTFTLNTGLRWDIAVPFTDATKNTITFFNQNTPDTSAINPANGKPLNGGMNLLGSCAQCVGYDRASIHWREFSPRLGFDWQLNGKTVVLGGISLNHLDSGAYEYGVNKVAVNYGNLLSGVFNAPSSGTNVPAYGNWDTRSMPVPAATPFTPGLANGQGIVYQFDQNRGGLPYVYNYNVGIQRELPDNMLLSLSYVGNRGLHLPSLLNNPDQLNPSVLNTLCPNNAANCVLGQAWTSPQAQAVLASMGYGQAGGFYTPYTNFAADFGTDQTLQQALRPFPQYGSVYQNFENAGISTYNALQMQLQKRMSNGLSYLVSYTLSKNMSNTDSGFASFNGGALNTYDQKAEYSVASNDQTHLLNISGVYELPLGPGKPLMHSDNAVNRLLVGGWQLSGIFQYSSGTPFGVGANGCPLASTNYTCNRSNMVKGQPLSVDWKNYYNNTPVYNTGAFSDPGLWAIGTSARNIDSLRNPWNKNEDLALAKHVKFTERTDLELRMEYFNILNQMQVCGNGSSTNNVSDGNFGLDSPGGACQGNTPRQGQATMTLHF